jgi:aldehyde:ferredoxin oxidoreductase
MTATGGSRDSMIEVVIDGKTARVPAGTYLLKAAKQMGIEIPALCDSELCEPYGYCRVCSVEVVEDGKGKIVTACNYEVKQKTEAFTASEAALKARRQRLDGLLSRWPNVKAIKDAAAAVGVTAPSSVHAKRNEHPNACFLCGLCIRVCDEAVRHRVLSWGKIDGQKAVVMAPDKTAVCVGCQACGDACPAGSITFHDDPNHPADAARIRRWGANLTREVVLLDDAQCHMRVCGTAHLVEIMNDYDLLPTHNHRFGNHPDAHQIDSHKWTAAFTQKADDACTLGCDMACAKAVDGFELRTGPDQGKKVLVDGPEYETAAGVGSNLGIFEPWAIIEQNYYCDQYGIDTISWGGLMAFIMECYEAGVLNLERTGGLDLRFGQAVNALEVMHQMARGEGFGLIAGQGVRRMKQIFAEKFGADPGFLQDIGMENKGLEYSMYVSKESLAQQGGYALTNKGPQHDEAWLIFMDMVNKQIPTFEDKAEALHYFPIFRTWFGLHGLCKLPWNDVEPEDNAESDAPAKVPKHVQGYCNLYAGMTGKEITPAEIIQQSERVYNLQRIFNLKMGYGTRPHDKPPYRSCGPVTAEEYLSRQERYDKQLKDEIGLDPTSMTLDEKRAAVRKHREDRYQKLCDAVYKRRGWTPDGIPTLAKVRALGIDKVPRLVELLEAHGVTE